MKIFVYTNKNTNYLENFEAVRMRKNIKTALELSGVTCVDTICGEFDVGHFVSAKNYSKINDLLLDKIPVVVSALMCENDPHGKITEIIKGDFQLQNKYKRVLNKVNAIVVNNSKAKLFLKTEGVTTPIYIIRSGINLTRFLELTEVEKNIFYRYFAERETNNFIISTGNYEHKAEIKKLIDIASICSDVKFYFFGKAKSKIVLNRLVRKYNKKALANLKFYPLVDDDVYRSAIINCNGFLSLNNNLSTSVATIEPLVIGKRVIIIGDKEHSWLDNDFKNLNYANNNYEASELIHKIIRGELKDVKDEKIMNNYDLKIIGKEYVQLYKKLIEKKEN